MNLEIIIRNYCVGDKLSVLKLIQLNTPKYFASEEEQDLVYYLENELENYFIVELNGEVVGSGGLNFKSSEENIIGVISWDLIHPNYQGIGIGKKLLEFRLNFLKSQTLITNVIVRTSQHVYKFYEKSGFELVEIIKDYWSEGFDLYLMKL